MRKLTPCPRCNKAGWLLYKPVRSYYHPKIAHTYTATLKHYREILENEPNNYRIQNAINSIKTRLSKDEKATRSKEYWYKYVVHYDHNKYLTQKQQYENGMRKSKPNGHSSCYSRKS
jgi:hypothetical protein